MEVQTTAELKSKRCRACEGGVEQCSPAEVEVQLAALDGWRLTADARRIRKDWTLRNFAAAMEFFQRVADLAEREGHHRTPDA